MSEWDVTKTEYNEGDRISSINNPTWDLDHEFSGIPIINKHNPCGYWSKGYTPTPSSGEIPIVPIDTYDVWVKSSGSYAPYSYSLVAFNDKLYMGHTHCRLIEWNELSSSSYVTPIGTNTGKYISDLISFNDKIYGVRNDGRLLEWNGTDDWTAKTSNYESNNFVPKLVIHNGLLYASHYNPGRLMVWNGSNAWEIVATYSGSTPYIISIVSNDSTILLGDNSNDGVNLFSARLFQWDGENALDLVANGWGIDTAIQSLAWFNSNVYGGTSPSGKLLKWDGSEAWTEVAPKYGSQTFIRDLLVAGGRLFGCTGGGYSSGSFGNLLEWNETDAWTLRASYAYNVCEVPKIRLLNGRIYGTSGWKYVYLIRWGAK